MAVIAWAVLGVIAGACIAIQAPINAQLSRMLGGAPSVAAGISFFAGAVILGLVSLILGRADSRVLDWSAPTPWLYFAGGCLGAVYVTTALLLTPRIGAAAVMAFAVTGQLLAGIMIDKTGFLGVAAREITLGRFAGAVLLIAGAVMIRIF